MSKEDIIGGLKIALSKGQKLSDAMQSFYNAGYKKEDIETAARELSEGIETANSQQSPQNPLSQTSQNSLQKATPSNNFIKPQVPEQKQKTSLEPPPKAPSQIPSSSPSPKTSSLSYEELKMHIKKKDNVEVQEEVKPKLNLPVYVPPQPVVKQFVSNYGGGSEKSVDGVTILLIIVLILLIGVLAGVFFFRDQLVEFLNRYLD